MTRLGALAERLSKSADEVEEFPHPSHCDHLHVAFKVQREAAAALRDCEALLRECVKCDDEYERIDNELAERIRALLAESGG